MAIRIGSSGIKTIEGLSKAISKDAQETVNVAGNLNHKKNQTPSSPSVVQGNKLSIRTTNFAEFDAPIRLSKRNSFIGGRSIVAKNLNAKQATAVHHFKSFAKAESHMRKESDAAASSLNYNRDKSEMDKMIDFLGDLGVSIENPLKKNRKLERASRPTKVRKGHERGFDQPLVLANNLNSNVMIPAESLFRPESKLARSDMPAPIKVELGEGNIGCKGLDSSHNTAISYVAGEMGFLYTKLSRPGELALYASSGKKPGSEKDFGHGPRIIPNGTIALLGSAKSHLERHINAAEHKENTKRRVGRKRHKVTSMASQRARLRETTKADVTAEGARTPQQVMDLLK